MGYKLGLPYINLHIGLTLFNFSSFSFSLHSLHSTIFACERDNSLVSSIFLFFSTWHGLPNYRMSDKTNQHLCPVTTENPISDVVHSGTEVEIRTPETCDLGNTLQVRIFVKSYPLLKYFYYKWIKGLTYFLVVVVKQFNNRWFNTFYLHFKQ